MKRILHSLVFNMSWPIVLITLVICVLLTSIVSGVYTQTILQEEDSKTETAFTMLSASLTDDIRAIQSLPAQILNMEEVQDYASGRFSSESNRIQKKKEMLSALEDVIYQQDAVSGIIIINQQGKIFGRIPLRTYFFENMDISTLNEEICSQILQIENRGSAWLGPITKRELVGFKDVGTSANNMMMLYVQQVSSLDGNAYYIAICVEAEHFRTYLRYAGDGLSQLFLLDRAGTLIAAEDGALSCFEDSESLPEQVPSGALYSWKGEEDYFTARSLNGNNWVLLKKMPLALYEDAILRMKKTVWLIATGVLLLALFIWFQWLRRFTRPFLTLKKGIKTMRKGNVGTRLEQAFFITEFEEIRLEFNLLNENLNHMMAENGRMEREQLELEMKNLQTQLSPHMIFNSLTAIKWMSNMFGATQVSHMLTELGEMLRPVFREWRLEWTLREELAHLEHYAKLLTLRYANRFQIHYQVPEDCMELSLPRFTIQPLVENACEHAGKNLDRVLEVWISVERADDQLRLTVRNNGKDIAEEMLQKIRDSFRTGQPQQGIGIYNVYKRLMITKGKDASMELECPEEGGTLIRMSWRYHKEHI